VTHTNRDSGRREDRDIYPEVLLFPRKHGVKRQTEELPRIRLPQRDKQLNNPVVGVKIVDVASCLRAKSKEAALPTTGHFRIS